MSPKKSSARKGAARKSGAKKSARKSSTSPMQKIERAVGPNEDGLTHQAQSAHGVAAAPPKAPEPAALQSARRSMPAAPMNTPPAPPSPPAAVDAGQKE